MTQVNNDAGLVRSRRTEALRRAVVAGNVNRVKFLLRVGANANATGALKRTALHLACESQHSSRQTVVDLLLKFGANVNARTKWGSTPLHLACFLGNKDAVEALLRNGANVELVDCECMTPLHVQAHSKEHNESLTEALLSHKASINAVDWRRRTPLHYFSSHAGRTKSVCAVLDAGGNANFKDLEGNTPLHLACKSNLREVVSLLLEGAADVGVKNRKGRTPLHIAAANCSEEVLSVLLDYKSDANAQDLSGNTPLHLVCTFRGQILDFIFTFKRKKIVEKLVQSGARVDLKNHLLQTPYDECVNAVHLLSCGLGEHHYELNKRLEILNMIKNHMLVLKMASLQDRFDAISSSPCKHTVFQTEEPKIGIFEKTQCRCIQNVDSNMSTSNASNCSTSSQEMPLCKPDHLPSQDVLLYFDPCLHPPDLHRTSSLNGHMQRIVFETSKVLTVQWVDCGTGKRLKKTFPYMLSELVIVSLYRRQTGKDKE